MPHSHTRDGQDVLFRYLDNKYTRKARGHGLTKVVEGKRTAWTKKQEMGMVLGEGGRHTICELQPNSPQHGPGSTRWAS